MVRFQGGCWVCRRDSEQFLTLSPPKGEFRFRNRIIPKIELTQWSGTPKVPS
jgi:hypothetical protein